MQIKTEEDQEKLLRSLLILAKQLEGKAFARYQPLLRLQMNAIRDLILTMEGDGAFRVYQWQQGREVLEFALQPIADEIAEQLLPALSVLEPQVQTIAAEYVGKSVDPTLRSANAMSVKATAGDYTLDEMLGQSGQDARIVKRMVENIDKVVKIGLLTERTTEEIANDVMVNFQRNGRVVPNIQKGTVANQNLNIINNMVRAATWDIIEQNLLSTWKKSAEVVKWQWNSKLDPNTCPICGPLDGETMDTIDEFPFIPPVHPNCRCSILPLRFE